MQIVDPLQDPRWAALRTGTASGTIFDHPAWLRLLRAQYGYEIGAWCLGDDNRLTSGLAVARIRSRLTGTRLVSVPFSDVTPPLVGPGGDLEALGAAVARERARTGLDLEVRGALPAPGAFIIERFVQHRLALGPDVEAVRRGFSKSQVRRGIAKAVREGVTVERRTDVDALRRFYALHTQTRRQQGVPTQPKRFILRFADLFAAGLGFVLLARHQGRDVAAAVFLAAGGTLTYKYGASDRAALGVRPNNLLFMEAIEWGCGNGARLLDFGRTDFANDGLRAFKSAWGAEETLVHYTYFADRAPDPKPGPTGRVLAAAIRRGPVGFGRVVGEAMYGHMG